MFRRIAATVAVGFAVMLASVGWQAMAAEQGSWGAAANGLRLGLSLGAKPDTATGVLRVLFQNAGPADMDVLVGGSTGIGPIYAMHYAVTDPNGGEHHLGYLGGATFVAGALDPMFVRLSPGETYAIPLLLKHFVYVRNRKDLTLGVLLRKGYSVRAWLEIDADNARWGGRGAAWRGRMNVWTGRVESGVLRKTRGHGASGVTTPYARASR